MIWLGETVEWREWLGVACALAAVVMLSYQSQTELDSQPASALETEVSP
jgi:drug/metabolite transporter (DMT)-like permease